MSSTQEALDHHLDCFGRGDLDGILAHYSSTAVMFTPRPPERLSCDPAALRGILCGVRQTEPPSPCRGCGAIVVPAASK
jgi:hypothetical protein